MKSELETFFDHNRLVRPTSSTRNFIDLVRALASLSGVPLQADSGTKALIDTIGPATHYIFILVDGFGTAFLKRLPSDNFFVRHFNQPLQAVFPSTTAAALTSFATGQWPSTHAIPGWWIYLDALGLTVTCLPFTERYTQKSLESLGVPVDEVFQCKSIWGQTKRDTRFYTSHKVVHSAFSRYLSGGAQRVGYTDIRDAIERIRYNLEYADGPTLSYLYLPQLDALCHEQGPDDEQALHLLSTIQNEIEYLFSHLPKGSQLIVSADHGQIKIPLEKRFILEADDPLIDLLRCPPSGEPVVPLFHLKPGQKNAFVKQFQRRFEKSFVLLTPQEAERLSLFGPEEYHPALLQRLGTFLAIATEPASLNYRAPMQKAFVPFPGVHAGLTPEEMWIPMIVASKLL